MSEKIEPALTPEEWAACLRDDGVVKISFDEEAVCLDAPGGVPSETHDMICLGTQRHAVAAAFLYGQPFGFTWEDVDVLRELEAEPANRGIPVPPGLADRIEVLLPPGEGLEQMTGESTIREISGTIHDIPVVPPREDA